MQEVPIALGRKETDIKTFGYRGMAYIGRVVLGKGDKIALGRPVMMDISQSHVVLIMGKRGYGKSYTMGVVMEEFDRMPYSIRSHISLLVIDTLGVFWTSRYPAKEAGWGLSPRGLENFMLLVPYESRERYINAGIKVDGVISLRSDEIGLDEWFELLNITRDPNLQGAFLDVYEKGGGTIEGMLRECDNTPECRYISSLLKDIRRKRFIVDNAPSVLSYVRGGRIINMDISTFRSSVRLQRIFLAVLGRKLMEERLMAKKEEDASIIRGEPVSTYPIVWLMVDEGHLFAGQREESPSREVLRAWAKLGRQPGLGLILATQQPSDLDRDIITQTDIFISHRLTSKIDLDALADIKPTYVGRSLSEEIKTMGHEKGLAVALDDITERNLLIKVRPRTSMHGGFSASALRFSYM